MEYLFLFRDFVTFLSKIGRVHPVWKKMKFCFSHLTTKGLVINYIGSKYLYAS